MRGCKIGKLGYNSMDFHLHADVWTSAKLVAPIACVSCCKLESHARSVITEANIVIQDLQCGT